MMVDNGIIRLLPQQYFHWLVVNVPVNDVGEGNEVMDYITPFSREDVPHPMLLLVYRQNGRVSTACGHRMANRKWKETKQLPSMLPGPAVLG